MTNLRADSITGEQWVLEERTADPPSTEEGERWLRSDLNSGDKIATLRVDVGSSIRDVPIFSTGTAVDTVSEAMRVQVNGETGYVPIAPVAEANYPELRMQHNSELHGFHDRVEPGSALPDSVVNNAYGWYDAENLSLNDGDSVTTRPDISGQSNDISGTGTYQANAINGEPSVDYDGSADLHTTPSTQTTPITWFVVFRWDGGAGLSDNQIMLGDGDTTDNRNAFGLDANTNEWRIRVGGNISQGGTANTNWNVGTFQNNGSSGFGRVNGTEFTSTTDGGLTNSESITIGDKEAGGPNRPFNGSVAEAIFVGADITTSDIEETEQALATEYGITL